MVNPSVVRPDETLEYYTEERCWILETWRDSTLSIARARVEPGITTALHSLQGVVERYLVVAGTGTVNVGKLTGRKVEPGDIVVIPEGVPQQIANTGSSDLIFNCICTPGFTPDCYENLESIGP